MRQIAVVDYGMGNLRSVAKALERVGGTVRVTRKGREIADASKIVLPGVGAFGNCMANLKKYDLIEPILQTIRAGRPFLGICLGLQLLFEEGEEFGIHHGLGLIRGRVAQLAPNDPTLKIPHMGWNQIHQQQKHPWLNGIDDRSTFYFVHSYVVVPQDPTVIVTTTDYGRDFVSAVAHENIFACQFHPEKSQHNGLRLLRNFVAT